MLIALKSNGMRMGGLLAWKAVQQDQTLLSSCEAKIFATHEGSKLTRNIRNLASDFKSITLALSDSSSPTLVYNDNEACVNWSRNLTTKGVRHMELQEILKKDHR